MLTLEFDGIQVRADARTRRVMWCSDWARIHTLPLEREYGGPGTFGHVDYVIPR